MTPQEQKIWSDGLRSRHICSSCYHFWEGLTSTPCKGCLGTTEKESWTPWVVGEGMMERSQEGGGK